MMTDFISTYFCLCVCFYFILMEGYPTADPTADQKKHSPARTKKKGDRGFLEGW